MKIEVEQTSLQTTSGRESRCTLNSRDHMTYSLDIRFWKEIHEFKLYFDCTWLQHVIWLLNILIRCARILSYTTRVLSRPATSLSTRPTTRQNARRILLQIARLGVCFSHVLARIDSLFVLSCVLIRVPRHVQSSVLLLSFVSAFWYTCQSSRGHVNVTSVVWIHRRFRNGNTRTTSFFWVVGAFQLFPF